MRLTVSFTQMQNFIILMKSNINFFLSWIMLSLLSWRTLYLIQDHKDFYPMFSSRSVKVLHLCLPSILRWFLHKIKGISWGSLSFCFVLVLYMVICSNTIYWTDYPSYIEMLLHFRQKWINRSISGLCILYHWSLCLVFINTTFLITVALLKR